MLTGATLDVQCSPLPKLKRHGIQTKYHAFAKPYYINANDSMSCH